MNEEGHIPYLDSISKFYSVLRIGKASGEDFSVMRLEDQPESKLEEMPLFRSSFYRIVVIKGGKVSWKLPNTTFSSSDYSIYFAYPGKLESWKTINKVSGVLICFTDEFSMLFSKIQDITLEYPFFEYDSIELLKASKNEQISLDQILEKIISENYQESPDKQKMLSLLLHQLLLELKRLYLKIEASISRTSKNNISIYNKFRKEVDQHFIELSNLETVKQLSVKDIASNLYLNPSYLNTVIKDLTNKTASSFINDKYILEAKSYLMHTDLQVSEIAYKLGFNTVTYFNRFFKTNLNLTPTQFRSASKASKNL